MKQHSGLSAVASIILMVLLVTACKPSSNNSTADPLPSLAPREVADAAADVALPVLLPTLVPYPTADPAAAQQTQQDQPEQQNSNPFQFQAPQNTESNDEITQQPVFPFGDLPETPDISTIETNPFLPPGVTEEDLESGSGGFPFGDGDFTAAMSSPFGDVNEDAFDFSSFGGDSSGGSPFGDLPFDPSAGPGSGGTTPFGFPGGDLPFGFSMSRYYIAAEQPVSLFECAETTCDVIGSLESNDPIEIVDQVGEWVEITHRGASAFVYSGFVGEREPMDNSPFGAGGSPFDDDQFPFGNNGDDSFPFGNNGPTTNNQGSVQAGQYSQSGGFSIGRGFSLGGNALYDQPTNNNNNGFPWGDDFFNDDDLGTDCPPFLPNC